MKKTFIFLLTVCFSSPSFCQFPSDTLSQQVKRIYTELGSLNNFSLFQIIIGESRADNAEVGGDFAGEIPDMDGYMFYEPPAVANRLLDYWFRGYTSIYFCNNIIESAPGSNLDEAVKQQYIAEAKFIRSLVMFTLANTFGAVPYPVQNFDWPIHGDSEDFLPSNKVPGEVLSLYEVYQQIEADLTEAVGNLPLKDEENNFRITSGAARAFLGKVQLYGSCFAKNYPDDTRFEGFTERYEEALANLESVINSGEYALLSGEFDTWWSNSPVYEGSTPAYRALFTVSQNGNSESVLTARNIMLGEGYRSYRGLAHTMWSTVRYYKEDGMSRNFGWGVNIPSQDLIDAFGEETGTVPADDPRFIVTVGQEGDSVLTPSGWQPMTFKNGMISANRKWECSGEEFWDGWTSWLDSPLDFPLIRYADVLLLAAEAGFLTGNSDKALSYTNMVRQRARESGSSGKPAELTTITYDDIMLERRVELAMEGHRFYDLLRWGLLSETLDGKYITSYDETATFIEGEHEFLPYSDTLLSSPTVLINRVSDRHVVLYPNPGNGKLSVESEEPMTGLTVFTLQGKEVCVKDGIQDTYIFIDLSGIEPGTYFIAIKNDKGMITRRYVKQ